MKKLIFTITALAAAVLLSGCFLPENFQAAIKINEDASYSFSYQGKTAFVPAAMEMKRTGQSPSAKTNQDLQAQAERLSQRPDVKKAKYLGDGRFDFDIQGQRKAGQQADVLDVLKVYTDKDGVINISSIGLNGKDKDELAKLGLKIEGKLDVSLPKNAEVISTNATSKPSLFGLFGTYSWKIGSVEDRPIMRVRIRQ